jgi:hypothetical protein
MLRAAILNRAAPEQAVAGEARAELSG